MIPLSSIFNSNTLIVSFDELKYFTKVKTLNEVFQSCSALEYVNFENVTTLNGLVCRYCNKMKSVYLPKVTTITGYYQFSDCSSLESVIIDNLSTMSGGQFLRFCSKHKWTVWRVSALPSVTRNTNWQAIPGSIYVNDELYDSFKAMTLNGGGSASYITGKVKKLSSFATDYPDVVLPEKVVL